MLTKFLGECSLHVGFFVEGSTLLHYTLPFMRKDRCGVLGRGVAFRRVLTQFQKEESSN